MADRYQDRYFPGANDHNRTGGSQGSSEAESDPLAELARLIGQTDPFGTGTMSRANLPLQPNARPQSSPSYQGDDEFSPQAEEGPPPGPPSWMQHVARQESPLPPPQQDYPSAVHPLHRYAAAHPPAQSNYAPEPSYADGGHEADLTRYDDALYGSYDQSAQGYQHEQAYAEDGYVYDDVEPEREPKRHGGMVTVAAVLALAVFGVGGAFAYRTYSSSVRSGEPPIIRADAGPTKIIPSPPDGGAKVPDRMTPGDSLERIVSREEAPLDPSARSGPSRVVFPPPNPNGGAPSPTSALSGVESPISSPSGTFSNEPHRIKTFSVRGDQADAGVPLGAPPAAKPATRAASPSAPRVANASANAPLSLSPQANAAPSAAAATSDFQARGVPTGPAQITPGGAASGGYLVQVSSQRSETDAQTAYRVLQTKYASVLGSQSVVVKRVDLGEKGIYYRAFAGPFTSADQATQVCSSLKAAGGPQCLIQRN
jgi:hypothetical protein